MKIFVKKIVPMIVCSFLFLSFVSCNETHIDGENSTKGNIINGGERPNYDEMFDYDSGYKKPDIDPNKMVTLTLDSKSNIKFKGGENTLSRKVATKLTADDFDLSSLDTERTLKGISVLDEKGIYSKARDLEDFNIPYIDATIKPYFNVQEGYELVNIGSGTPNKFNGSSLSGSFKTSNTLSFIEDCVISGDENSLAQRGGIISEENGIDIDSAFRLDSSYTVVANTVYQFEYSFENFGESNISFNLYQVSSGSEYANGNISYKNRHRINVDLNAGESKSYMGQYKLGENGNFLTYMVANDNMNNIKLGISMSVKPTNETEPKNEETTNQSTLTLLDNCGITFANGMTSVKLNENEAMPAVIYNNDSLEIAGWYNVSNPSIMWSNLSYPLLTNAFVSSGTELTKFTMPERNTTIAPIFAEKNKRQLVAGGGVGIDVKGEGSQITGENSIISTSIGAQIGSIINIQSPAYDGTSIGSGMYTNYKGTFRVKTITATSSSAEGALKAGSHTFNYYFKNLGDETIKFIAYQVLSGTMTIEGKDTGIIELKAGESWQGSITVQLESDNNNAMTIYKLLQDQSNAKLGVVISKNFSNN